MGDVMLSFRTLKKIEHSYIYIVSSKWEEVMKKVLFGIIAVTALAISLYAGVLTGQSQNGTNTICYYSDGGVINAGVGGICPATN